MDDTAVGTHIVTHLSKPTECALPSDPDVDGDSGRWGRARTGLSL